ncbi:ubiqutin family protein [Cryptosporidium felis]|nr:ubiqutin family protein [Cryptosporidium felis]
MTTGSEGGEPSEGIRINVKMLNGEVIRIPEKIDAGRTSVLKLKEVISNLCDVPVSEIRLVWRDKILSNSALVSSYGLEDDCTVILARSPPRGSSSSRGSDGDGISLDSSTEDFLSSALASPWMQSILNDPEIFRTILDSNPQLKALREQNPELNHIFNDPQFLQMSVDVLKNPELMREMMRNSDRAISNIESIPGGFSALKRMYHTVQEPMWDAATYNPNTSRANSCTQYNIDKSTGPNSEAFPNPWGGSRQSGGYSSTASGAEEESSLGLRQPFGLFPFGFGGQVPGRDTGGSDAISSGTSAPGVPSLGVLGNLPNLASLANIANPGTANPSTTLTGDSGVGVNANGTGNDGSGSTNGRGQLGAPFPNLLNLNLYSSPFDSSSPNAIQTVIDAMRNMDINNGGEGVFGANFLGQNDLNGQNRGGGAGNSQSNMGLEDLLNIINSGNTPSVVGQSSVDQSNTDRRESSNGSESYNYQLEVLSNMGFTDTEACIKALSESDGSINRAIDKLLNPN